MKRTLSLLLVLATIMGLLAAIPMTASAATAGTIKLSSGTMNVRKSASTSASKVGTLRNGDEVEVHAQTTKSGVKWYKITSDEFSGYGYVQARYVTLKSSGSTSSSGSSTSTATGRVRTKTMKIYQSKSTKSTLVATAEYGDTVTVLSMTSSSAWARVRYDGKTGYCNKSSMTVTTGSSSGGSTSAPAGGNGKIDAAFVSVSKPSTSTYTTQSQVTALLNYNLANFNKTFNFKVNTSNSATLSNLMPKAKSDALYGYLLSDSELASAKLDSPVVYSFDSSSKTVYATIHYNAAGEVLAYYKNGTPVSSTKGQKLLAEVQDIIESETSSSMSDYEKALALHDYIVLNSSYSTDAVGATAYGALVDGKGACQGYAEATGLLYTLAGLENYVVRATNKSTNATHGYVKVKIDGDWYNVDTTANDPKGNATTSLRHDFFLVSDEVIEQRYTPWLSTYPEADSMDQNYFVKNGLVCDSLSDVTAKVQEAVKAKKSSVEVWVDDYSSSKYSVSRIRSAATSAGAKSCTVKSLASSSITQISLFIEFTY